MSTKVYLLYYVEGMKSEINSSYTMPLKNQLSFFVTSLLLFGLAGCQPEEVAPLVSIDANLLPYFERFESEALQRGIQAEVTAMVSGKLTTVEEEEVVAQCEHYTNSPNVILVDQQYWQNATELEKEYLIFHELGHCFLERSHLETKDSAGNCTSIMQSGQGNCRMNYTYSNREGYLDELFD